MTQECRYRHSDVQKIKLSKVHHNKRILDIGGGGEGIIGKLYGKDVVAIDLRADELYETTNESLKIEMNAADMKFIDGSFDAVTSFYTLMYMSHEIQVEVLKECFRVLKNEGFLEIWDIEIPQYTGGEKDIFLANLEIEMPNETIKTGYGVLMNTNPIHLDKMKNLCEMVGFTVEAQTRDGESYYLRLKKS